MAMAKKNQRGQRWFQATAGTVITIEHLYDIAKCAGCQFPLTSHQLPPL